ncbi:hypothetical protein GKC30_01125 [Pseudodesulfovibrio sp. F-1]|uniref:Uncharacterized protein n=1 Tax=Pseudodesulfovibrio alkaliphilus TaxID=2661613 RepID=A0A7K1KJK0_9BACT|nr:hypothetical protein [Pseudodesulfovibrio alkaliphilus]MUM76229.1 hypothetical protein [Pseudodesulfovibrio alkaliphilus]
MPAYAIQCPYCHAPQHAEHPGGYAPMYVNCPTCEKRFILEPVANGVKTYRMNEAPCCSDPDCRAAEMGDTGND